MPSYVTPLRATEFIFYIGLVSQADNNVLITNPTIAGGDWLVTTDGNAFTPLDTTPVVDPAGGTAVAVTVSIAEMTGDNIFVVWEDVAGAEWASGFAIIQTATIQMNDLASAADIATAVWAAAARTLTSYGTLTTDIALAVWTYARRTLTMSIGAILSSISGNEIQLDAGDYIEYNITDLGSLVGRTKLWWTLKASKGDTDVQSLAKIEETIGLEYIAGVAAGTPANGSITVTDAVVGNITIVLAGAESVKLIENEGKAYFDIKWINAAGQELTLRRARALIVSDITRETA